MNLSAPFVHRPVATMLLAIGLALAGAMAYRLLPVAALPRVDFPMISVTAVLPGADPSTIASSVAAPLERRFGQISGVTELTSTNTLGSTLINIQFDLSRSVDSAARDVQAAINAAASELPPNLPNPPTYRKVNPADTPILVLALTSDTLPSTTVFEAGDEVIAQRLSQLEGVSQVIVSGAEKSAVRVQMNPAALSHAGMNMEDVRFFLSTANLTVPKGQLEGYGLSYSLKNNDQIKAGEEYESLILRQVNGLPIPLNAMGTAFDSVENNKMAGWKDEKRAVLIIIFKQTGANVIETVERIKAVMPQLQHWIPPSIVFSTVSDRTQTIRASFIDVQFTLVLTIALVVMMIFLFLRRFWPTFIASITVPLAISGTFGLMYLLGFTLDNLSLMALTISVGFVVDDAIVVIENVFRYLEDGHSPKQAALKGAKQIGFTVLSISISLVAVFIPLLFMGGLMGRLFREFSVTLSAAILISGLLSLTLTPMLCSQYLRRMQPQHGWFGRFSQRIEVFYERMLERYERGLRWVLRHQPFMLLVAILTLIGTVALYVVVPKGFFPQQDTGLIFGITEAAQDISFYDMQRLQKRLAKIALTDPSVSTLGSFIGASAGGTTTNSGRLYIDLKPLNERSSIESTIERLQKAFADVPGIRVYLQALQDIRVGGRITKAQYIYALQGADLNELNHWASLLLERLQKLPILTDVTSDQQISGLESRIHMERDLLSRFGLNVQAVDNTLYDSFGQRQVSIIYKRFNQHHVVMEALPQFLEEPLSLEKIFVTSSTGFQVPLTAFASYKNENTYLSVNHQSQFPAVTISFNLPTGISLGMATEEIRRVAEELRIPDTIQGSFQGTAKVFEASLASTPLLFLAAIVTVYIVLGMLYESLVHPITILSTLPSAGLGALIALILTGNDLSLVSFIGIILLIGIVKKNAIMMVDFALEEERLHGLKPEESIYRACVIRFRPIMMTTMATLLGAIPLAVGYGMGSELRRPLGVAVVGGLIVSQTLTLFTTPVIYLAFEHLRVWVQQWRRGDSTSKEAR